MTLADSIFQTAVQQAKAERDRIVARAFKPQEETPIVRDMRATARELGIVADLLQHQRIIYTQVGKAYDLVEGVLIALGVSNAELLHNLQRADDGA